MTIKDFPDSIITHSTRGRSTAEVGYGANCHGYTITGEHTATSNWREVIRYTNNIGDKRILVYTYKNNVSHSGRIEGETLIHYIKGVGVVTTPIEIARHVRTEYKDGAFELPAESVQYNIYMEKQHPQRIKAKPLLKLVSQSH